MAVPWNEMDARRDYNDAMAIRTPLAPEMTIENSNFFNRGERGGRRESQNAKNQNEYLEFCLRIYLS
jgi:hypothetical protein